MFHHLLQSIQTLRLKIVTTVKNVYFGLKKDWKKIFQWLGALQNITRLIFDNFAHDNRSSPKKPIEIVLQQNSFTFTIFVSDYVLMVNYIKLDCFSFVEGKLTIFLVTVRRANLKFQKSESNYFSQVQSNWIMVST